MLMIFTILLIVYILIGIFIIIKLLLNGIHPTKTLAWMLAVFTIPVGGMLLYLSLGRNRRKNKLFEQKNQKVTAYLKHVEESYDPMSVSEDQEHYRVVHLISKNSGFAASSNNSVTLLKDGEATFNAIFSALEKAEKFIHLQYYIFENGELANRLFQLFESKSKKGVSIRILYDGIGSFSLSKKYIRQLRNAGCEVYSFLPIQFGKFLSSINYRNHRKIIVIDNQVAFTGGINISDKYIKGDPYLGIWHDRHVKLEGPIVHSLHAVFAMDWYATNNDDQILSSTYFIKHKRAGCSDAQIVHSGPDSDFSSTQQVYFSIINQAKRYVYIINPYIIPGEGILKALQVAALSGVDVRLLLSDKSDSSIVRQCVRSYFEGLLKSGVNIYLFPENFLHSKIIIADDTISSIGTTNMDIRSFEHNYEINAVVYDDKFAKNLRNDFLKDCNKSIRLKYDTFVKRPWHDKLKEGIAKVFSPVL